MAPNTHLYRVNETFIAATDLQEAIANYQSWRWTQTVVAAMSINDKVSIRRKLDSLVDFRQTETYEITQINDLGPLYDADAIYVKRDRVRAEAEEAAK